ncbi:MAG: hypothetical protein LUG98_02740 [Tannerellaceae bacterium]|nr:hypothetical protein [Tannerellaceae bacterium]
MKYLKYEIEIVEFDEIDVFTIEISSGAGDDGGTSGKYSTEPEVSDI